MVRVLYVTITGSSDATRASIPFHLMANGSAEVGHQVDMVLGGDATDLLGQGVFDAVRGVGVPPLRELVDKAIQKGVAFHV